jgi:hypothetical protein
MPMPPMPTTTTDSPGCTSAAYTAEPQPVVTPQPTSAAFSSGMCFSIFTALSTLTTVYGENVPSPTMMPRSRPSLAW